MTLSESEMLDRYLVFYPEQEFVGTPRDARLDFDHVRFPAADGPRLHGWFVPGESDVTFLWFHGNAGNISHRIFGLSMLRQALGVSSFIFDYRGYGFSEGTPSEKGTYRDAEAAVEYLSSRPDVNMDKLVLFGHSLGCAVAVEMALHHKAYGLVLESPFDSIKRMAQRMHPRLPMSILIYLLRSRYDSMSKIGDVHAPVLVLHGDWDETIPIDVGRRLFEAANEPKRFHVIEGGGHNDGHMVGGAAYYKALRAFVEDPTGGMTR